MPELDPTMAQYAAELLQEQLNGQEQATAEFNNAQAEHTQATKDLQAELFKSVMGKRNAPQRPPQVEAIANALAAQPALIPAVSRYLEYLVGEINRRMQELTTEAYGGMPGEGQDGP